MIGAPDCDTPHPLQAHMAALPGKIDRLGRLIGTIDQTILHLPGG